MPQLDVSSLLTDIDFCQTNLICNRLAQTVGEDGLAVNTPTKIKFTGVVTSLQGEELRRNSVGELITGSILICTRFRLIDGKFGYTADVVTIPEHHVVAPKDPWGYRTYTVVDVNNYSRYGRGFIEATCEPLPLAGSYSYGLAQ